MRTPLPDPRRWFIEALDQGHGVSQTIRVRNPMGSVVHIAAVVAPVAIAYIGFGGHPRWLGLAFLGIPLLLFVASFCYLLVKDPQRLQNEDYLLGEMFIQKHWGTNQHVVNSPELLSGATESPSADNIATEQMMKPASDVSHGDVGIGDKPRGGCD